jgi:hypothetical protein
LKGRRQEALKGRRQEARQGGVEWEKLGSGLEGGFEGGDSEKLRRGRQREASKREREVPL